MEIKEHRLQRFIELYQEEFGIMLTRSEAHEKATKLLHYVSMCMKPFAKINDDHIIERST